VSTRREHYPNTEKHGEKGVRKQEKKERAIERKGGTVA